MSMTQAGRRRRDRLLPRGTRGWDGGCALRRILASVVVGCLGLAIAGSASATQIQLSMSTKVDPSVKPLSIPDGTLAYGWYGDVPVQVYEAKVFADDGQPVENACLTGGARIEILDTSLKILDGAGCTNRAGKWQFVLTTNRVKAPTMLTAQLLTPATTLDGRVVSPAASNMIIATIAPRIVVTSPKFSTAPRFPVAGSVKIPTPRKLGTVLLQRQKGSSWTTLVARKTDARGRFTFTVARGVKGTTTTYRVRYQTIRTTLWAPSSYKFTITWV